ncbi:hypothetical protein GIB67_004052, partial [Kingdonia uniflora]
SCGALGVSVKGNIGLLIETTTHTFARHVKSASVQCSLASSVSSKNSISSGTCTLYFYFAGALFFFPFPLSF